MKCLSYGHEEGAEEEPLWARVWPLIELGHVVEEDDDATSDQRQHEHTAQITPQNNSGKIRQNYALTDFTFSYGKLKRFLKKK